MAFGVVSFPQPSICVEAGGHPSLVFCWDMLGSFLPAAPLSAGLPGAAPTLTSNTSSPGGPGGWGEGGSQSGQALAAPYFFPGLDESGQCLLPLDVLLPGNRLNPSSGTRAAVQRLCSLGLLTHPGHHLAPCHCPDHLFVWPCDCFLFCLSSHPCGPVQIIHGWFLTLSLALGQSSTSPGSFVLPPPASGPCSLSPEQGEAARVSASPRFSASVPASQLYHGPAGRVRLWEGDCVSLTLSPSFHT